MLNNIEKPPNVFNPAPDARDLIFGILGGFARGQIFDELLSRGDTAAPLRTLATSELLFGADTG